MYRYSDASWTLESKLVPIDGEPDERFGFSVALQGDTLVVGAFRDDDNGDQSGSAYVFRYNADSESWEEESTTTNGKGDALQLYVTPNGEGRVRLLNRKRGQGIVRLGELASWRSVEDMFAPRPGIR